MLVSCGGDIGVHVVVTMDPALWGPADGGGSYLRPIDHVIVRAEQGDDVAMACLFARPYTAVPKVIDEYACANLQTRVIDSSLTPEAFALDGTRSVNFVFTGSEPVKFQARAGLGNRVMFESRQELETPSVDFPGVELRLEGDPAPPLKGPNCDLAVSDMVGPAYLCESPPTGCLYPDPPGGPSAHTGAARRGKDGCAILNVPGASQCDETTKHLVALAGAFGVVVPNATSVNYSLRGRFVRCRDGGDPSNCELTVDCDPPATFLTRTQFSPVGNEGVKLDKPEAGLEVTLSCMPPTMGPIELRVPLSAKPNTLHIAIIGQEVVTDPSRACFFEIQAIDPN